ncbi:hypothetical protein PV04_08214 [Phialophora macrospora]|uniref:Cyclin N-terminal domain-containing protein n=1 Tax=Phialophora macrospora TaxID=1851006 RepID=A0A0D2DV89_9EURO|nr:hypothetical protein PV04_08214 [Phialophora macrospora]
MPSYQSWGVAAHHPRLPPTPPEYQTAYLTPLSAVSEQGFYPSQGYQSRRSRDYNERYQAPPPAYTAQPSLTAPVSRHGHAHPSQDYPFSQPYHVQGSTYWPSNAVGAPILPPIRVTEPLDHFAGRYAKQHNEAKPKEEKPTGGVAQHLDYDMDLMSGFVAEMSQKLVTPESAPTSQFRKYVSQILSSTRLPSSTIMLGLFYLQSRMKQVKESGSSTSSSGTVYRMLTTCLLLGSKFLDDNTFQNRSWAEVSSIPVHELNMMELQWLTDFNWEIHGMMYDEDEGFFIWVEHWHAYEEKAQLAKVKEMQKLAPIETNLHRHHNIQHQPLMSPEGPIPPQYQQGAQYDTRWVRPYMSEYSPPSAPHSGPSTPDYYTASWSFTANGPPNYGRQSYHNDNGSAYSAQRNQLPTYAQTFGYASGMTPTWMSHGPNCGCSLHAKHSDYYFSHPGYAMQPVVG